MFRNQVTDKDLLKTINKKLVRLNVPPRVLAEASRGVITMTGPLRYEIQRKQVLKAVNAVPGVQQVIDHLLSPPKRKPEHN